LINKAVSETVRIGSKYFFFYVSYFGFVAITAAYFPVYCKFIGFSSFELALVSAAASFAVIIAPPALSHIAHYWHSPRLVALIASMLALLCFLPIGFFGEFWSVIALWGGCLWFFWGMLPLVESAVIRDDVSKIIPYGKTRIGGSLGFIAVVLIVGLLVDGSGPVVVLKAGAIVLTLLLISTFAVRDRLSDRALMQTIEAGEKLKTFLISAKGRSVLMFLAVFGLIAASHGALYTYFSVHLSELGFSGAQISAAWIVGVVAEILLFMAFHKLESKFSLKFLLNFSIILTVIRWLVLSVVVDFWIIFVSQILHAFSFGAMQNVSVKVMYQILPKHLKAQSQALLISLGHGLGGLIGRIAIGFVVGENNYYAAFLLSTVFAVIALILAMRWKEIECVENVCP
jgi:PPP family 3-phenylpropionic acid transporter